MGYHTIASSQHKDDARRVMDSLRRIVRSLRLASRTSEKLVGLTAAQLFLLQRLADSSPASVNELAARTLTHQSSASVVITKLVDRGLIRRSRSKADGRRQDLSLTPAAKRLLRKAPHVAQDALVDALISMKKSDVKKLADLFARFVAAAGIADQPAQMFDEN